MHDIVGVPDVSAFVDDIPDESLPAHFERVAAAHAARLAVGGGDWQPTYGELNAAANRIAHALIDRGGEPGDRVAVLMRHDAPMIAAILGVLKAGRILTVLNPIDPPARLRQLVAHTGARTVLTDTDNLQAATVIAAGAETVCCDDLTRDGPDRNPALDIAPGSPAFIVYTSGSTGEPNGVVYPHTAAISTVHAIIRVLGVGPADRALLLASVGGGQGIGTLLMALLTGASVWPFPAMEKGVNGLADLLSGHAITVCTWSASIFRHLAMTIDADRRFPAVRAVRIASETATSDDFRAFQRHFSDACTLTHSLASGEAGQISYASLRRHDDVPDAAVLPVGRLQKGVEIALLDEEGREVPPGQAGEIVVTSWSVTAGYWRNPALTAERYFVRPDAGGRRSFRTRDLARWNPQGQLEFIGRKNRRLKIRGHTIEPLEIERALCGLPGVKSAIVCAFERAGVEPQLVGFVIAQDDQALRHGLTADALKCELRSILPRHMVPAAFQFVNEIPLTPNGKTDRDKLMQMFTAERDHDEPAPPKTDTEAALVRIWSDVLELAAVGRTDDFFELGGDSLNASVVAAMFNSETGVAIDLGMLFEHPRLADLASVIDSLGATQEIVAPPIVPASRDDQLPLSFPQEQTWIYSQNPQDSVRYHVAKLYRIVGPLDVDRLRDCMSEMVRRHDIMRTIYTTQSGRIVQIVRSPQPVALPVVQLARGLAPEAAAARLAQDQGGRPFDLSRLPLMRSTLLRVHANEHWLVQVGHHINLDSLSARNYFGALSRLYAAAVDGTPATQPETEQLQYKDYAAWQRHMFRADGPVFARALSWWTKVLTPPPPALTLPFARPHALANADPADGWIMFGIRRETGRRLDALARRRSTTAAMVRLAAFLALLGDETGLTDVSIGIYAHNRHDIDLQNMLGFFANLVRLRMSYDPHRRFDAWLAEVGKRAGAAEAHGELPYYLLQDTIIRSGIQVPAIEAIFSVTARHDQPQFADLEVTDKGRLPIPIMPWGFTLSLCETTPEPSCRAVFDAGKYDPAGVRTFIERYTRLLDAVALHPDLTVGEMLALSRLDGGADPRSETDGIALANRESSADPSDDRIRDLEGHIVELEARVQSLSRALSRVRRQARRLWPRPPLWRFEQHPPKPISVPPAYRDQTYPPDVPSLAIVTPSLNQREFLPATIDSILTQDYPRLAYRVQDGGSTDGSTKVLRSYGAKVAWRSERDGGQAQAINRAFATCDGDIMAYLNSDDMLLPGTLAYVARTFHERPDVDVVYGHRIFIDRGGMEIGRAVLPRHDTGALFWADYLPQETMFWRRRVWDAVGPIDESFQYALDWDFILRAQHAGFRFMRLPRFLACFRVHDKQKTSAIYDIGREEMMRLRRRYLGHEPTPGEIAARMSPYLIRQLAVHWLYQRGLLRY